jgi:hypothetical protein
MNSAPLRKTILKELGIFAGSALVLVGIIWYLMMLKDGFVTEADRVGKLAEQVRVEKTTMENKFTTVKTNLGEYEESKQWAESPGLFIDGQAVRDLFNIYQANLMLKKLAVEIQPVTESGGDPKFMLAQMRTSGKITMTTTSDQEVYDLIDAMQRELPGFVKFTHFTITKDKTLTKEILAQIRREGSAPVMSTEIRFDWFGLRSNDPNAAWSKYVPKNAEAEAP